MPSVKDIRSYFMSSDNNNEEESIESRKSSSDQKHEEEHQIYLPKCIICGLKFLCEESLDRHKSKPHFGTTKSGKIGKYQCDFDGKFFSYRNNIHIHMKDVHLSIRQYKCEICSLTFKTKTYLKNHGTVHNKKFKCSICLKKFAREIEVKYHKKKNHKNRN